MKALVVIASILVAGCAGDVCKGKVGTCTSLHVEGSGVSSIDQLKLWVTGALTAGPDTTPPEPTRESLPIDIALQFPAGTSGQVVLTAEGFLMGKAIADGTSNLELTAGAHQTATLVLHGGAIGDMSAVNGDMSAVSDGSPDAENGRDVGVTDLIGTDAAIDMEPASDMTTGEVQLIAPLSSSTATQKRPIFTWKLPPGASSPVLTLCLVRGCATSIVNFTYSTPDSATPTADISVGLYYWTVTATTNSGTIQSATWELSIKALSASTATNSSWGVSQDLNGDGFADIALGGDSRLSVYTGNSTALTSGSFGTNSGGAVTETAAEYADSLAIIGDTNGDGLADLAVSAVCAPYDTVNSTCGTGQIYLYDGDASNGINRVGLLPNIPTDAFAFGQSMAGVDINGDGYIDLIVGAPQTTVGGQAAAGRIYVYLGSRNGLIGAPQALDEQDLAGASFGYSVAGIGDIDGDGYGDVAVGAFGASNVGRVNLYFGSASGLKRKGSFPALNGTEAGGWFGRTVAAAGDINGDGFADVLVGAPIATSQSNAKAGRVFVFFGGTTGVTQQPVLEAPDGANGYFGMKLASGDVDNDGFADVLIGAPCAVSVSTVCGNGMIHLYRGSQSGLSASTSWSNINGGIGMADVDGDGFVDFFGGGEVSPNGVLYLYRGAATIPTTSAKTITGTDGNFATIVGVW